MCRGWKEAHGLGISVRWSDSFNFCVYGDGNGFDLCGRAESFVLVILEVSAAGGMASGVGEAGAKTERLGRMKAMEEERRLVVMMEREEGGATVD